MILKKVYISRGTGGGQGQFGKSLHFEFFFFNDGFPYRSKPAEKYTAQWLLRSLVGFPKCAMVHIWYTHRWYTSNVYHRFHNSEKKGGQTPYGIFP